MTFQVDEKTTVRDLVGRYPQTRPVFEKHGIDYCCGGGRPLADAARQCGQDEEGRLLQVGQDSHAPNIPSDAISVNDI